MTHHADERGSETEPKQALVVEDVSGCRSGVARNGEIAEDNHFAIRGGEAFEELENASKAG